MTKTIDLDELQLLSTHDAAKLLGVSPGTLLRMGADGTIPPPVRMTRNLVRWRLKDLRAVIEYRPPQKRR